MFFWGVDRDGRMARSITHVVSAKGLMGTSFGRGTLGLEFEPQGRGGMNRVTNQDSSLVHLCRESSISVFQE